MKTKKTQNLFLASLCWLVMFVLGCFAEQQVVPQQPVQQVAAPQPPPIPMRSVQYVQMSGPVVDTGFFKSLVVAEVAPAYAAIMKDYVSAGELDRKMRLEVQFQSCRSGRADGILLNQIAKLLGVLTNIKTILENLSIALAKHPGMSMPQLEAMCAVQSCGDILDTTPQLNSQIFQLRKQLSQYSVQRSYFKKDTVEAIVRFNQIKCE